METGFNQVHSSLRGQLTFELVNHQEPAINNSGDVVWTQMDPSGFYQIYKLPYSAPAPIAVTDDFSQHSMAAVSNSGEVIWAQGPGFSDRRIYSNMRGQLTGECPAGLDHSAPSINACGDITFTNRETEYLVYRLGTNAPCLQYTVTPSAGANGSISPSTPQTVNYNQTVSFTIMPNTGYHTASVTGCNGTLDGTTYTTGPISADCTVTATFEVTTYALTVTKAGTGSGTVTSSPGGINCGGTCSSSFASGSSVTLTAASNPDSLFVGWSGGGCSGTGACTVIMDAAKSVTATFNQYITVTAPNGGENWIRNSTYTITWSYSGNPGSNIRIELLKAGVLNRTISNNRSRGSNGVGSYNWKVPSNQITGTDFTIRITSTSNNSYTDTSDANFAIY